MFMHGSRTFEHSNIRTFVHSGIINRSCAVYFMQKYIWILCIIGKYLIYIQHHTTIITATTTKASAKAE